jgi:hypothetical protein
MRTTDHPTPTSELWHHIESLLTYARELQNNLGWPKSFPLPAIQRLELTQVLDRPLTVDDLRAVLAITKCALVENDLADYHRSFFAETADAITKSIEQHPDIITAPATTS